MKVFGGAATGYITNNLALNMLFKKYGPFGGVILETKSEFIENAAELVERDIINHNTVSSKLYSQEFEAVSEKIIADILHKYIYEHTGDIICKDIPGFNSTSTNILNFLEQNFNKYLDHYLALAEEHSTTGDILSQKQITYISSKILPEFISVVKYNDNIDDSLLKIYKKYQHKKIKHLLVSDIFEQVSSNIGKIDPGSVLQVNKNQIEKFMKIIDFSSLLDKVIVQENNKKSSSMIELQITTNQDKVSLILQNTKIKKVIKALINGLLDLLEEVDSPLIDIFSPKFAIKVEKLINSQLPNILANIIFWIKDNKVELESLIEEATEEVLNESTGIKNNIKRIIFKSFRENIEKKHKIIDRIINQLEGQLDVEQFSQTLTKLILSYFKNTEISEIIKYLRENNLLKSEELLQFVLTHFIDSNYIISKNKVT
ncbi:MAG: hypothetical protein ACOC4G_02490, partial [Bacillota bacterium]